MWECDAFRKGQEDVTAAEAGMEIQELAFEEPRPLRLYKSYRVFVSCVDEHGDCMEDEQTDHSAMVQDRQQELLGDSLDSGKLPEAWKTAKERPLFKKGRSQKHRSYKKRGSKCQARLQNKTQGANKMVQQHNTGSKASIKNARKHEPISEVHCRQSK
eukprot:g39469.t1